MSGLTVDPSIGLPSAGSVIGSVPDGIALPYQLDLGGRSSARLVLTLDGVTASDASGPASGTITVPAQNPSLTLSDHVQVQLQALDPSTQAVVATATTVGRVSNGAQLPATPAITVGGAQRPATAGDTLYVNLGDLVGFQTIVASGANGIRLTGYDLTMDGVSILTDPKPATLGHEQWVQGSWTAPSTVGSHTLVLSASVEGTSAVQSSTFTFVAQPAGSLTWTNQPGDVDLATGVVLSGLLKVASTFTPVSGAVVDVTWTADGDSTWTPVGSATTGADGRFSLPATPAVTGRFLAHTAGVANVVGDTESGTLSIGVRAHVLLAVDQTTINQGGSLSFDVNAPTEMAGVNTLLQLWNGVCWCTVAWTPMGAQGVAHFTYVPPTSGTYRFAALTSYADPYAPTPSADLTVTVR